MAHEFHDRVSRRDRTDLDLFAPVRRGPPFCSIEPCQGRGLATEAAETARANGNPTFGNCRMYRFEVLVVTQEVSGFFRPQTYLRIARAAGERATTVFNRENI